MFPSLHRGEGPELSRSVTVLLLLLLAGCTGDRPTSPVIPVQLFSVTSGASLVVSDQASCTALPAATTWASDVCTLNEDLTLSSGGSLQIQDVRLTVPAGTTLNNDGGSITVVSGGALRILGELTNTGGGTISNSGFWDVRDGGAIANEAGSTITTANQLHVTQGTLTNAGTLINTNHLSTGVTGAIVNTLILENSGLIKMNGGSFDNSGIIQNTGTIDVGCSTGFTNTGAVLGTPVLQPYCWVGGHGNLWSEPANWNKNSVPPAEGPIVLRGISGGGPVLDIPFTLTGSLQMHLATLVIGDTGALTNEGTFTLGMGGNYPGTTVLRNEGTLTNNGTFRINDLLINNGTAVNHSAMEPSTVVGVLENRGDFTNASGAFFEGGLRGLTGGQFQNLGLANLNRLTNSNVGLVLNGSGATMNVNNELANDPGGQIENDGILNITHDLNHPARLDNAAGAIILNRAQFAITAPDVELNNDGLVENTGVMDNGGIIQNNGVICGSGAISGHPVSGNPAQTLCNSVPAVDPGGPYDGQEGHPIVLELSGTDPDGDPLTFTWDLGDGTTGSGPVPPAAHTYEDDGAYTITLTVEDGSGESDTATTTATIVNLPPSLGPIAVPAAPVLAGNPVSITASFTDPGSGDTHTGYVRWNPSQSSDLASPGVDQAAYTLTAQAVLPPGVYQPELIVEDDDGGTDSRLAGSAVVVYEPAAGFLTGRGWFQSPAGAFPADPGAGGKGHFSFDVQYHGVGFPEGTVSFELPSQGLEFESTTLHWMIVIPGLARVEGEGTVGGLTGYGFRVTAVDNGTPGRRNDRARIRIWELSTGNLVYDNQDGEPVESDAATLVGGGNIRIHR